MGLIGKSFLHHRRAGRAIQGERFETLSVAFALSALFSTSTALPIQAADSDIRRDATVTAIEQVMPSVVNIATETIIRVHDTFEEMFLNFWDPYHRRRAPNSQYSLGSGVVIDEAGFILTNDHVVRRADKIAIKFATGTNVYEADLVASDPKSDVALLKLRAAPGERFAAIKFARDDDLLLGETVIALGNPFGLGGSVSRGILSSKSRMAPKEGVQLDVPNWLQTDASINHGNSGGPLVNLRGELIGINVAVLQEAQGIGFAIPIKRVVQALSEIFPGEFVKSYWFGARVKAGSLPLLVATVQPHSPAEQAGLKVGDAILQVNGAAPRSFIDFADLLSAHADTEVMLKVLRGGESQRMPIRLVPQASVFNEDLIREKIGLKLTGLTPQVAASYGLGSTDGFIITGVQKGGPAAASGLNSGALVTAIEGQTPPDVTAVAKLLFPKKTGDLVHLDLYLPMRHGNYFFLQPVPVDLTAR